MDFVYFSTKILIFCFIDTMVIWRMCMGTREGLFRTIGGRDARPHEFPYVVRMEIHELLTRAGAASDGARRPQGPWFFCTAVVLTRTATLTAAHCSRALSNLKMVENAEDAHIQGIEQTGVIRYGSATGRPSDDDSFSKVLYWYYPPSGRPTRHEVMLSDLALLETQPILLSVYARVSAIDYRTAFGQRVAILGHGLTNGSKGLDSTLKLGLPLQVVDAMWSKCDLDMPYPLVCAVEPCSHHATACPGDSGGPVLHASGVVGVTSGGPSPSHNCQMRTDATRFSYMDYIVPLSIHLDWIEDTIALITEYSDYSYYSDYSDY